MKKLIYLLTLVLITSCETEQLIKPEKYSLEEARKGFEKYLKNNSSQLVSGKVNQEWLDIEKTIFWDKARPLKSETNFDGYIVPIWYDSAHRFGKQTIRALWAYENKETNEEVFHIVEIMATHEHMIKHHGNINLSDFTGIISIQDWHGGFMGGFEYKNGIKTGEVTGYIITDNVNHISERKAKNKDCGFQYSYVQNGEIVIVWYSQPCMTYWWIAYSQQLVSWAPQMWVDSQYGCEVTGGCVGETYPYEIVQDWLGKENGLPMDWWSNDDAWLNQNIRLEIDGYQKNLTQQEIALIRTYPSQALSIMNNIKDATELTIQVFGKNGLNDKSDAFRHAIFNAMNERDCGKDNFSLESIAKKFANAHESEVPQKLNLEKQMDLWNNEIGFQVGDVMFPIFLTDATILEDVLFKLQNGELRFLSPLNFTQSPLYDGNNDGIQDCSFCINGITNETQLTPTNQ